MLNVVRRLVLLTAAIFAGAAPLAGCSSAVPFGAAAPHDSFLASRALSKSAWLYIADDSHNIGIVYLFAFPGFNKVKAIERIGDPGEPCADSLGHVWLPAYYHQKAVVFEFALGSTKPIGRISIPRGGGARGCAVDPVTGDLAVLGAVSVDVYANGGKGKPTRYSLGSVTAAACAFDGQGNLFVDAMRGSSAIFLLYELPKGSKTFGQLTVDKRVGFPGGLVWDGAYVAISTGGNGLKPVIYRFTVSGKTAKVVQAVHPKRLQFQAWFTVGGGKVVGTAGIYGPKVDVWPYPTGGPWLLQLDGAFAAQGMTIATAPK